MKPITAHAGTLRLKFLKVTTGLATATALMGTCTAGESELKGAANHHQPTADQVTAQLTDTQNCVSAQNYANTKPDGSGLREAFVLGRALPLSGHPVMAANETDAEPHGTCIIPPTADAMQGTVMNGNAVVSSGNTEMTYLHEWFHTKQFSRGGIYLMISSKLTVEDKIFTLLLMESTAASYELVLQREANNRNIPYARDPVHRFASDNPRMRAAFDEAYARAEAENLPFPNEDARMSYALGIAGQAATRFLLEGNNLAWSLGYMPLALLHINGNEEYLRPLEVPSQESVVYLAIRDELYKRIGAVSGDINLTPPELLTSAGSIKIENTLTLNGMGFVLEQQARAAAAALEARDERDVQAALKARKEASKTGKSAVHNLAPS